MTTAAAAARTRQRSDRYHYYHLDHRYLRAVGLLTVVASLYLSLFAKLLVEAVPPIILGSLASADQQHDLLWHDKVQLAIGETGGRIRILRAKIPRRMKKTWRIMDWICKDIEKSDIQGPRKRASDENLLDTSSRQPMRLAQLNQRSCGGMEYSTNPNGQDVTVVTSVPSGRWIVSIFDHFEEVAIINVLSPAVTTRLRLLSPVFCIAARDADTFIAGLKTGHLCLLKRKDWNRTYVNVHRGPVNSLALHPVQRIGVSVSTRENTLRLWDTTDCMPMGSVKTDGACLCVKWSPSGNLLAVRYEERTKILDYEGKDIGTIRHPYLKSCAFTFINDSYVALGSDLRPLLYRIAQDGETDENSGSEGSIDEGGTITEIKLMTSQLCQRIEGLDPIETLEVARCFKDRNKNGSTKNLDSNLDSHKPPLLLIASTQSGRIIAWDLDSLEVTAQISVARDENSIPTSVHSFPMRGGMYDGNVGDVEPFRFQNTEKDSFADRKAPLHLAKDHDKVNNLSGSTKRGLSGRNLFNEEWTSDENSDESAGQRAKSQDSNIKPRRESTTPSRATKKGRRSLSSISDNHFRKHRLRSPQRASQNAKKNRGKFSRNRKKAS